jgi:hypothetical protein
MYVIIIVCLSTAMVKPTINKKRKNERKGLRARREKKSMTFE